MAFEIIDDEPKGGRFEIEEEDTTPPPPAELPPPKSTGRVQKALLGAVPLIGPLIRDVDVSGLLPGAVSGMSTIGQAIGRNATSATAIDEGAPGAFLAPAQNVRPARKLSDLVTGNKPRSPAEATVADREASIAQFNAERADDPFFEGARILTPIAATLPVGNVAGAAIKAAAPRLPWIGEAVASGGFKLGAGAPTGIVGRNLLRAGGAATNAAAQSLAMGEDAETIGKSAAIASVLPGGVRVAERVGTTGANLLRKTFPSQLARDARTIARVGELTDLPAARAALSQTGPHLVGPGGESVATAPQILQNPGISQLQRTLRNAGDTRQVLADQAADAARDATLARVGNVAPDLPAARGDFGTALERNVRAADEAARVRVEREFDAVDPFDETRFLLPIDKMRAAREKFLGRGTFGKRAGADAAVSTAENIGTEVLPAVQATAAPSARKQGEDLFSALRSLGGIKQDAPGSKLFSGELNDLKQSGARVVIQNGRGQSPDVLAQAMHARGFIPDDDPATLLNAMRDHAAGNKVFSVASERGGAMKAGVERAMGDAPGAETIERAVPFREVQNLRSSIGEAHADAAARGRTREAAALDKMRREIDLAVDNVAAGGAREGENFPADIVNQWRDALAAHQSRMQTFRTGPQEGIFRANGPRGGELAGQFFSPRLSQTEDIAAFGRIADPETTRLLKDVAVTELNALRRGGRLSPAQVDRYLAQRGGAVRGLFTDAEIAQLTGVRQSLNREAAADSLNTVKVGSNTAQNIDSALSNGLLDSQVLARTVRNIPLIGPGAGSLLEGVKGAAKKSKVDRLGRLLAEPIELERALAALQRSQQGVPLSLGSSGRFSPLAYRALPLLGGPALSSGQ
jgi:hypothetical protein